MPTYDKQVDGDHYVSMALQPWQIVDILGLGYYEATALGYLLRRKGPNRVTDLKKAIHVIEHMVELEEEKLPRGSGPRPLTGGEND